MQNNLLNRLAALEETGQVVFPLGGIAYRQHDNSWNVTFSANTELSGIYTDEEKVFLELRPDVEILSYEEGNK